jgi:hypothetical protein
VREEGVEKGVGWVSVKCLKFLEFRNFRNFWILGWRKGWGGIVSKVRNFWISGSERLYSRSPLPSEIGASFACVAGFFCII